eukprot:m.347377 g.347377  ORF g.347377 m.347377 type:complete len:443 (-) comp55855_c0_seq1:133-1461(-)
MSAMLRKGRAQRLDEDGSEVAAPSSQSQTTTATTDSPPPPPPRHAASTSTLTAAHDLSADKKRSSSTGVCEPTRKERLDVQASMAAWFNPRPLSLDLPGILVQSHEGAFSVSPHGSRPGDFILIFKFSAVSRSVTVFDSPEGLHFPNSRKRFPCLSDLVRFYSSPSGLQTADLPCMLKVTHEAPSFDSPVTTRRSRSNVFVESSWGMPRHHPSAPPTLRTTAGSDSSRSPSFSPLSLNEYGVPASPLSSPRQSVDSPTSATWMGKPRLSDEHQPLKRPSSSASHEYTELEVDPQRRKDLELVAKGSRQLREDPLVDAVAREAPWCCLGLSKQQALLRLKMAPQGSFVIRPSAEFFAALTLVVGAVPFAGGATPSAHTLKVSSPGTAELYHAHIEQHGSSLRLKKSTQVFPSLTALVNHYRQPAQTDLPCPLAQAQHKHSSAV